MGVRFSPLSSGIESYINHPMLFNIRSQFGKGPGLHPDVKIYSFDDQTSNEVMDNDLPLDDWRKVIESIAKQKPRAIIIPKYFGLTKSPADIKAFNQALKKIDTPIIIGSFVSGGNQNKQALPFTQPDYSLRQMIERGGGSIEDLAKLSWMPVTRGEIFGPREEISKAFTHIGHLEYIEHGFFRPLIRVNNEWAIPHIGLFAGKQIEVNQRGVIVDERAIPLLNNGQALANIDIASTYERQSYSLKSVIIKARQGKAIDTVTENHIIIIAPNMITGGATFVKTPVGDVLAEHFVASIINSVITGKWITYASGVPILILLSSLVTATLAFALSSVWFWLSFTCLMGFIATAGVMSFVAFDMVLEWIYPAMSAAIAGLSCFILKSRALENRTKSIQFALEGVVSKERLKEVLQNPQALDLKPSAKVVTILFIDIAGFSLLAETQSPVEVFDGLRDLIRRISKIVHSYQGIVDNVLGDGLLCFFGHNYGSGSSNHDHADTAVRCAIAIQREMTLYAIEASKNNRFVHALRIGINTSSVYIGDLGGTEQIRPTLIGHGVNYAKRLESACDSFKILISAVTRDLLTKSEEQGLKLTKKLIQIKHHEKLFEAYEIDPFVSQPELYRDAVAGYRKSRNIQRADVRFIVPQNLTIIAETPFGKSKLVDYSDAGFGIAIDKYLGTGVRQNINLSTADGILQDRLSEQGLINIVCDTRWGRHGANNTFVHGLQVSNLDHGRKAQMVKIIRQYIEEKEKTMDKSAA
jgi:class 3 adenylate cyclase